MMTAEAFGFFLALILVASLRAAWLAWLLRVRSPLDVLNDDLARARARRRR